MMNDGRKLYLQEKYDGALKYLREDDPFESLLIESIRITPKDKSTNEYLRSPQLTLISIGALRRWIVQTDHENCLKFLKKSSNKFIRTLVEILEKIWEFDKIDSNLLNSLNECEKAIAWYYIGFIYSIKGNYKKAKDCVKVGIKSCEKVGEKYHKALMLHSLGIIYLGTGYLDMAYEIYKKALKIFKELNDWYNIATINADIAELYYRRRDAEMCLKLSKQALNICEEKKYRGSPFTKAKAYMGLAYLLMRDYDMALKHLEEVLQIFKKEEWPIHLLFYTVYKALIYMDIGRYDEALRLLEEVEEIYRTFKSFKYKHYEEWVCAHKAIVLLERGDIKRAKKLLLDTLELAKYIGDLDDIVRILVHLVRATGEDEYIDEAIFYYKKWRTSLPLIMAKDVLSTHDVRVLVDSLLGKGKDSEAYDMLLESKNRSAIDIFGAKVVSEDLIGAEGVKKIRKAEEIVRSAERPLGLRSISGAREIISEVIKPIVSNPSLEVEGDEEVIDFHFGERSGYFYSKEFKDIKFNDLRGFVEGLLRNESVKSDFVKSALLKLYGKRGIKGKRVEIKGDWVFIVYDRGRYWWANLNRRDDLLRLLSDILLACLTHSSHTVALDEDKNKYKKNKDENKSENKYKKLSGFYNQISEEVLRHLGEEVFKKLFEYDEVIIAPAYPLMNFPYHLLMNGKKTLIEEVRVKYVPHSGVARRLRDKGKEDLRKALEKVTIVYYRESYEDKEDPSSIEKEAKEIEKILPEANLIDATDIEKEELLSMIKEDSEVLHFACHAIAMPKAQYSYFEFPNFKLYLPDFLSLKLKNLKMACLSACETGRFEEAIDTLGFPLAFFAKGAKCVLATLWRVYGESTKKFFIEFYKHILSGSDVYEAYHSALMKLKEKEEWKSMYFWGPFVYYGI